MGLMSNPDPRHAGDPRHADHEKWLFELGRATYAAARVAGICFDLARIFGDVESAAMYSEPLGTLINRLRPVATRGDVPGLADFISHLEEARDDRNDLLHALPVAYGLHRRKTQELGYVRNFYDVEDLVAVTSSMEAAARVGNRLLYHDGGAAVRRWYERAGGTGAGAQGDEPSRASE